MLDVKKLITGFLVLALGASASAWIFSNNTLLVGNNIAPSNTSPTATLNGNAFINETTPQDVSDLLASEAAAALLDDPNNLTGTIGNSLLDGLVSSNPDGISTSTDGYQEMNLPDNELILSELSQSPSVQNIHAPDWDAEVASYQTRIKVLARSSSQNLIDYANAFTDINNKYFVLTGLEQAASDASTTDNAVLANNSDPSLIINAAPNISQALADAMQLDVPAPFSSFQKSWVKLLVYEKNTASLFKKNINDPAQTALAIQFERDNYNSAIQEFRGATKQAFQEKISSRNDSSSNNNLAGILRGVFGIKIADAQTPLTVPVYDPLTHSAVVAGTTATTHMSWSTYLLNLARNVGLQILTNTLVAQLQSHVLKWIQNSGAPRFVQNWADDFANAGIMSARTYINNNFACINNNGGIFPSIQLTLNAFYKAGNNICAAQAASQLNSQNLTNFYNSFSRGGFLTFGQTMLPSNNYFGGLFFTAQGAGLAAQQSQSVLSVKTTAQQGWKGTEICADKSNPNGTHTVCLDKNDIPYHTNADGSCDTGLFPSLEANNGKCSNGASPQTVNPGQVTGQMMNQALGVTPLQITGAKTIDGLLTSLATSLISALAGSITQTVSKDINNAIDNLGSSNLQGVDATGIQAPTGPSSLSSLSCFPISTTASVGDSINFSAEGGYNNSGNLPTYTWKSSDGKTGTDSSFNVTYSTPGSYTITLKDSNGDTPAVCTAIITGTSTSSQASCAPAVQTITLDPIVGKSSATFSIQGGTSGSTYTWSAPGAATTSASNGSFIATYNTKGVFTVFEVASADNSSSSCTVILQ